MDLFNGWTSGKLNRNVFKSYSGLVIVKEIPHGQVLWKKFSSVLFFLNTTCILHATRIIIGDDFSNGSSPSELAIL